MVNLLIFLGLGFVGLAILRGRMQAVREQKDLLELKQVRDDLVEAKKEVGSLLEQLEVVSEKVVEEITAKVEEAKHLDPQKPSSEQAATGHKPGADQESFDNRLSDETTGLLVGDEYWDEVTDEEDYDPAPDYDVDGGFSGAAVDMPAGETGQGKRDTVVEDRFRDSITQLKQKAALKTPVKGKTIMFPRRNESPEISQPPEAKQEEAKEVSPKHQMVYAMDKLGYSEEEIAKQLKIGKGEVSLMLQLKRKGEEANA